MCYNYVILLKHSSLSAEKQDNGSLAGTKGPLQSL